MQKFTQKLINLYFFSELKLHQNYEDNSQNYIKVRFYAAQQKLTGVYSRNKVKMNIFVSDSQNSRFSYIKNKYFV